MWKRFLLLFFVFGLSAYCYGASLVWNASIVDAAHGAPTGYRVHWGSSPGVYTGNQDAGLNTTWTIPDDWYGQFYFVTSAYNTAGSSGYSNEVLFTRQAPTQIGATGLRASRYQVGSASAMPSINLLTSGSNTSSYEQTANTASFTPTVGGKCYLFVWAEANAHTNPVTPFGVTTASGTSNTWTKSIEGTEVQWDGAGDSYDCNGALYVCVPTSGARVLTIDANTNVTSYYYYAWVVVEVVPSGSDFNPADAEQQAIVIAVTSEGGGNSESSSVSLGSNPSSSNYVLVLGAKSCDASGAVTGPTGYTSLVNNTVTFNSSFAFYRTGTTTATASFSDLGSSVGAFGAAIVEIKIAAGGASAVKGGRGNLGIMRGMSRRMYLESDFLKPTGGN